MIDNLIDIPISEIETETQNMLNSGYRFMTATCVDNADDSCDIFYHFAKNMTYQNYRIKVKKNEVVPSISKIFFCAVLVENEIKELFGINIKDLAIDFGGHTHNYTFTFMVNDVK